MLAAAMKQQQLASTTRRPMIRGGRGEPTVSTSLPALPSAQRRTHSTSPTRPSRFYRRDEHARLHHSVNLPVLGHTTASVGINVQQRDMDEIRSSLALSTTNRTMGSTLSSTWRELMPAGYDVHEYKSDLALKAWVKQVDGRKGRLQVKKLRVANQEAAWILRRRENQMKELVVQKKLNQEMEAKARAKSEEIAAQLAERERQARRLQRVKDGLDDVSSIAVDDDEQSKVLQWQAIEPPVPVKHPPVPLPVWVKPGRFTQKSVYA